MLYSAGKQVKRSEIDCIYPTRPSSHVYLPSVNVRNSGKSGILMSLLRLIPVFCIYFLLVFSPLARGAVQPWSQLVIFMVIVIGIAAFCISRSLAWDWQWIPTVLDRPILAGLGLCILSFLFSVHRSISLQALILPMAYLGLFFLIIQTTVTRRQLRMIVSIILGVAFFLSVFGICKRFGLNPFPWWEYNELKYKPDFLAATFGNHNHLAGYLEMALPLLLGLFIQQLRLSKLMLLVYIALLMICAHILSLSRGGWIALLLGLTFMATVLVADRRFKSRKILMFLVVGLVLGAFIILASTPVVERVKSIMEMEEEASFHSRVVAWQGVYRLISAHPTLGTGPGTFADVFTQYQPPGLGRRFTMAHNDYLQFIADCGLLVIPLIAWLAWIFYREGFEKLKTSSRLSRGICLGAMAGITAILVHSIIDFNLHIPANAMLFVVLIALVVMPVPRRS